MGFSGGLVAETEDWERSELLELVVVDRPLGSVGSPFSCISLNWTSSKEVDVLLAVSGGELLEPPGARELFFGLILSLPIVVMSCSCMIPVFTALGVTSSEIVSEGRLSAKICGGRWSTGVEDDSRRSVSERMEVEDVNDRAEAFDRDLVGFGRGLITSSVASSKVS